LGEQAARGDHVEEEPRRGSEADERLAVTADLAAAEVDGDGHPLFELRGAGADRGQGEIPAVTEQDAPERRGDDGRDAVGQQGADRLFP
jgi:hypothetical protein